MAQPNKQKTLISCQEYIFIILIKMNSNKLLKYKYIFMKNNSIFSNKKNRKKEGIVLQCLT